MSLSALFIDVKTLPDDGYGFFQLLFLGGAYAYILCYASNMISDGSELLLLIPSVAGLVGSVVLPVLGAVPDGAIVLFSGIGPDAQEQLTIGIGALAGSTIMLLTAPWFLSVLGGRVNIVDGKASYTSPKLYDPEVKPKVSSPGHFSWLGTGVDVSENVNKGGYLMLITSISFIIIQLPATFSGAGSQMAVGVEEKPYAFIAMLSSIAMFFGYLYYQYVLSEESFTSEKRIEHIVDKITNGAISLRHIILAELHAKNLDGKILGPEEKKVLLAEESPIHKDLKQIISPFFKKYDKSNKKSLDITQLSLVMTDLGMNLSDRELQPVFRNFDKDGDNKVDIKEFVEGIIDYITNHDITNGYARDTQTDEAMKVLTEDPADEGDDDDDEEEVPEDMVHLSHDEQQRQLWIRASWICGVGTILVVLFSDPMVDVLNELGARTGIPQFYVAFVLAPLASNASEVIASFNYAQKKTAKSMAISLSALQGACCMNNTFVLGIFMICVYTQSLAWQFFAETLSILVSVIFISVMSLKSTHTMFDALLIMMVYPLSLVLVYLLEAAGFD